MTRWAQVAVLIVAASVGIPANPAGAKSPQSTARTLSDLQAEMERIAQTASGVVGVSAYHVESGQKVSIRGTDLFPMASVYKIPIAVQFLSRADRREVSLDREVIITEADLRPGRSFLPGLMQSGMVALAPRELLRLMIVESDNTSSDTILMLAGGAPAVTARMRALCLQNLRVDRSVMEMALDEGGVTRSASSEWTFAAARRSLDGVSPVRRRAALARFLDDQRDTAAPDDLVHLLFLIHHRKVLSRPSAELLVTFMKEAGKDGRRLNGLLPSNTPFAHKSGTLDCCTNDVGIMTLPGGKGHVAMAVLIKGSTRPFSVQRAAIAEIGRAAYEHWSGEKLPRVEPKRAMTQKRTTAKRSAPAKRRARP